MFSVDVDKSDERGGQAATDVVRTKMRRCRTLLGLAAVALKPRSASERLERPLRLQSFSSPDYSHSAAAVLPSPGPESSLSALFVLEMF